MLNVGVLNVRKVFMGDQEVGVISLGEDVVYIAEEWVEMVDGWLVIHRAMNATLSDGFLEVE